MKILPSFFLTSFCALLASATLAEAQAPRPRFGYGSAPQGGAVSQTPKTVKPQAAPVKPKAKPVVAAPAKPKPKPDAPAAKPKAVVASNKPAAKPAAKPAPAKPSPAKAVAKTTPDKKAPAKPAAREVAAAKPKPAAKPVKAVIAKASPAPRPAPKAPPAVIVKPAPKPAQLAATPSRPSSSAGKTAAPRLAKNAPAATGPGDLTGTKNHAGFNFFGVPVVLPKLPATQTVSSPPDRKSFVDVIAARQALMQSGNNFKPRLPEPKTTIVPTSAAVAAAVAKEAPAPFIERSPAPEEPTGSAPDIAPESLDKQDFQPSTLVAEEVIGDSGLMDEPTLARTAPASLSLAPAAAPETSLLETPLLEEPSLPEPVISKVEKTKEAKIKPAPAVEIEPPLPVKHAEPAARPLTETLAETISESADEHDLSERERAFVRSLAEAAGSVTSASGKLNQDLPDSIATAASAVMNQIPAETVSTFRSVAMAAKSHVHDVVPDLPLEMGNDLMPATPEKMPDRLPTFNAPASGKIDVQSDRQADYDQANNKVIFTGKVELNSATIRLRAERVEVFMKKGGGGMERVEASGNVLMRTQDTENGPGQMASAGRASYNLKTGEITLADWPKIQEAGKSHISTDPSTKMYMFTDGRLRTDGPNRTLIGGE